MGLEQERAGGSRFRAPALILAADHRARGVVTIERYDEYLRVLTAALAHCDGILASAQPLGDLVSTGAVEQRHRTYLSINRTGLAGSAFELDDRLVATVARAATDGLTGVKQMTRIDLTDARTSATLEQLSTVLEQAAALGLEAIVESVMWRDGVMACDTDSIVLAAVIAHDLGAPVLKVPVPAEPPGAPRVAAVSRVVASVGVPVLFLGGPRQADASAILAEARDVITGGAAGMAIGRALYQDPSPAEMAKQVADIVHRR